MYRFPLLLIAALLSGPALAQQTYRPGATISDTNPQPHKLMCWNSTTSAYEPCNLSGSGGSGSATPTGTAGSPNAAVVTVQGISGGTPQNVNVASALPAGTNVIGGVTGLVSTGTPPSYTTGTRGDFWLSNNGALVIAGVGNSPTDNMSNAAVLSPAAANGNGVRALNMATNYFDGTNWQRMRGDQLGSYVISKGGAAFATGQVSIGTTSSQLVSARTGRQKIRMKVGAANSCAFGASGVTLTTGYPLEAVAGASTDWDTAAAVFVVCSATTTVSFVEFY